MKISLNRGSRRLPRHGNTTAGEEALTNSRFAGLPISAAQSVKPSAELNNPQSAIRNPQSAFTLIEMVLAIGVAAIVLVTISSVFFAALRLRNATQDAVDAATPVDQTLAMMKRDLACVVTPTNGTTKILSGDFRVGDVVSTGNGAPVAIEMFTSAGELGDSQPWGNIQRVTYELRDPTSRNAAGKDLFRSITRNLLASTPATPEDQWMMGGVQSITFSCYDGVQWSSTWDTTGLTSANTNLPVAVRVDIQPVGNQMAPIEMVVPIDSQTRSNVVLNANTNSE